MKKLPPLGIQYFSKLRSQDMYYVDKTPYLKAVMENPADVLLITRPRRFGKTLFLNTLKFFLQINPQNPEAANWNRSLFDGLAILQDREFCDAYMGRYPVVNLSLLFSESTSGFEQAYQVFAQLLESLADEFSYLADSPKLSELEKAHFRRYLTPDYLEDIRHLADAKAFLRRLVAGLAKHFGRPVVVLIDEYDVPLAKAAQNGYYDQMLDLIRAFLGQALKPDQLAADRQRSDYLKKAVLTGCLRLSKESLFTDFNNPDVNTVCSESQALSRTIGFTTEEVKAMLDYYQLGARFDEVKAWYDGYRFCDAEIYCPWDVVNFCSKARESPDPLAYAPKNYWVNTANPSVISEFLGFLSGDDTDKMQALLDGRDVVIEVNEALNYDDLARHRAGDFWTLLLMTGYLTVSGAVDSSLNLYRVRIPNREIRLNFEKNVKDHFASDNNCLVHHGRDLAQAALSGDVETMENELNAMLDHFVSIRDTATKAPAENYYHGFLNATFAHAGSLITDYRSNPEAGDGYADIAFIAGDGAQRAGVLLELKHCRSREALYDTASVALAQVAEKRYDKYFSQYRCARRFVYGLAFCGKTCAIVSETPAPSCEENESSSERMTAAAPAIS